MPQIFGMNYKTLSKLASEYIDVSSCNQWYMYQFNEGINDTDKEFFGYNEGMPMNQPNSSGVLNSKLNFMSTAC